MADTYRVTVGTRTVVRPQQNMPAVVLEAIGWARRGYRPAIHRGPEEGIVRVRHVDGYYNPAFEAHQFAVPAAGIPRWAESVMTLIQENNPKESADVARD